MTEIEIDEISIESTSEKSCKKLIPNCNPDHLQKLTPEGSKLNEQLFQKCVENNFPIRENRLKYNLLNSKEENSNKKIEKLENILEISSEPNGEVIDTDENKNDDISVLYHNSLNSEDKNSNNTLEHFDYSLKTNTEKKYDINDDKINENKNILETPKLNSENNDFSKINENINDFKKIKEEKNIENKDKIEKFTSIISKLHIKNENLGDTIKNSKNFLGKKKERNNEVIDDDNIKMEKQKTENIFAVIYPIYRRDYYIKDFKEYFLNILKKKVNGLINNIQLPKKIGKLQLHTPNRKLYGGNSNEEDNKKFIDKTIKDVFIDQGSGEDKKGTSRQEDNEIIFNKIEIYQNNLSTKLEKKEIYKKQYEEIEKLNEFLGLQIKDALDQYYDNSDEFGEFRSKAKIRYYDEKFKIERNRNLSLLEFKGNDDNNFVKYVKMDFYRKNNK